MIGHVISNVYVVEEIVGQGGMAVVYKAYDKLRKKTVAIKVLRTEFQTDREFVERFSKEALAMCKVYHENIVRTLNVGQDGDIRYIVMEYIEGETLKQMVRRLGRIPPDDALRITIRILAAVDHAHKNGIVHRDLKPQNILVDRRGRIKVADFGIARFTAKAGEPGEENDNLVMGSVHYFSPEQAMGHTADERSDLYSVGVMFYEMLTGVVPFEGKNAREIAQKHIKESYVSPRTLQSGISVAMEEVLQRALTKDPDRRYQTAAEMARDLQRCLIHPRGGFVAYPDEESRRKRTQRRRRARRRSLRRLCKRILLVLLVLLLGVVALGIGYRVYLDGQRITLPKLVGCTETESVDRLTEAGLAVITHSIYDEECPEGTVISQSVPPETRVQKGSLIELIISAGSAWYELDDYVGRTEAATRNAISKLGTCDITFNYIYDGEPIGTVVGQSVPKGRQKRVEPVVITVSGRSVRMPNLTGMSLDGAQALLRSEGLTVGTLTEAFSEDAQINSVIRQSRTPGSITSAGTRVDMTVSLGAEEIYYPASIFTVPVPLDNVFVEVYMTAPSSTQTQVYAERVNSGTLMLSLSGNERGMYTVTTYIDGILMDSTTLEFN